MNIKKITNIALFLIMSTLPFINATVVIKETLLPLSIQKKVMKQAKNICLQFQNFPQRTKIEILNVIIYPLILYMKKDNLQLTSNYSADAFHTLIFTKFEELTETISEDAQNFRKIIIENFLDALYSMTSEEATLFTKSFVTQKIIAFV